MPGVSWLPVAAAGGPGYDVAMSEGRSGRRTVLWGATRGAACGLAIASLYYLYEQLTRPDPYSLTPLIAAPVLVALGAVAGLLAAAWHTSD